MTIGGNAPEADFKYNDCGDLVFSIDDSNITNSGAIDANTNYTWSFKDSTNTNVVSTAGVKNEKTFTVTKSELSVDTFYVNLIIDTPTILV